MSTGSEVKEKSCAECTVIDYKDNAANNKHTQDKPSLDNEEFDPGRLVYLTLGDGDFTYSLDLARYFNLSLTDPAKEKQKAVKLIVTGIDTLDSLTSKYKDAPSILEEIKNQQCEKPSISVSIRHGVNAIVHSNGNGDPDQQPPEAADHVLFHHPHLGTENCSLHKLFLAHLFHSANNYWMKQKGGVFHLTLVEGQYDRWKCLAQAERHGLELLHKSLFAPPPVERAMVPNSANQNGTISSKSNRYHYRRHQTGKSFATRRPNSRSITYTFGRTIDKGIYIATGVPWETPHSSSSGSQTKTKAQTEPTSMVPVKPPKLSCPFCDKKFLEKRSLKCHLRDKHPGMEARKDEGMNDREQPRKKKKLEKNDVVTSVTSQFLCLHCQPQRAFQSAKALESHNRAKHSAIYAYIAPDWSMAKQKESNKIDNKQHDRESSGEADETKQEECCVCGVKLFGGRSLSQHLGDFMPVEVSQVFACNFCSKTFREERAKLQHMNFCSKRTVETLKPRTGRKR